MVGSRGGAETRKRRATRALALAAAVACLALAVLWVAARPSSPDAFYDPPAGAPAAPGKLIRSEPFARDVPQGARGWRILYGTTRADGRPSVASALVVAPAQPASSPRAVVAWAHGTTGIARGCAPSLMAHPFLNTPGLRDLLDRGWAYVATDYQGLGTAGGHAYLMGDEAARAVLDSLRAAREMQDLSLDGRAVVWGHSQGGLSALWTGMRAGGYAPDVGISGIAALAPSSDLPRLAEATRATLFGKVMDGLLATAYAETYADVELADYVNWPWRLFAADIATRCIGDTGSLLSLFLAHFTPHAGIFARSPTEGAFGRRLAQNTPAAPIAAPVLIGQGLADDLVLPAVQDAYVAERCAAGQAIDYRLYPARNHLTLLAADSPAVRDLIDWTAARFAGAPAAVGCRP